MLENMRKQGASLFVWVIFGILIAMFVVSFGPQSVGSTQGCQGGGKVTAIEIGDESVDDAGFRFAYNMARGAEGESSRAREQRALEALIQRELLAQEAERRGLRVDDELVDYAITQGEVHYAGQRVNAKGAFFDDNGQGVFVYKQFRRWLSGMGLQVSGYKRQQRREMMASTMARILSGSVPASREEARALFVAERTTVVFDVVEFEPARYAAALLITDADLDRYLAAHEAEVKASYQEALYKGKKQVRVRRVFVAATPAAAAAAATDPAAPAAIDPARAKLVAARADLAAGRKKLADVAATLDADAAFRARGGDWGWYDDGAPTLPDPALNEALKGLTEVGQVSEVIDTGVGFYVLTVTEKREGDLTFDQVKRELAEKLARQAWGQEAARRAAIAAVGQAQPGKPLRALFPEGKDVEKTGALPWKTQDVPAGWMQAGGSGAGSAAAPAAGAGSAAVPAAGAGSAAPGAAATDALKPAVPAAGGKPTIMIPSDEVLPALGPVVPPAVDTFGPVARRGTATPVGDSADIARALFDELAAGETATQIYEVKSGAIDAAPNYVLLQVTAKQLADMPEFEKNADRFVNDLAAAMGARYLQDWLRTRCVAMANRGAIKPARDLVTPVDDEGRRLPVTYAPCESLVDTGGFSFQ